MRVRHSLVLILVLVLSACALRNNPNVSPLTKAELNVAYQLEQASLDYENFFIGVGKAKTAGILNDYDIQQFVDVGNNIKKTLETANGVWKKYQTYKDAALREQVIGLLTQINNDLLLLYTRRATLLRSVPEVPR